MHLELQLISRCSLIMTISLLLLHHAILLIGTRVPAHSVIVLVSVVLVMGTICVQEDAACLLPAHPLLFTRMDNVLFGYVMDAAVEIKASVASL